MCYFVRKKNQLKWKLQGILSLACSDLDFATNVRHHFQHPMDLMQLNPEQKRAVDAFTASLRRKELLTIHKPTSSSYCINQRNFFSGHISTRSIPNENGWFWNVTHSTTQLCLEEFHLELAFKKVIPRKSVKPEHVNVQTPKYKLWLFHVTSKLPHPDDEEFSFLWCERGKPVEPESPLDASFFNV